MVLTSIYKRKGRAGYTLEFRDPRTLRLRQKAFKTKGEATDYRDRIRAAWRDQEEHGHADVPFEEFAASWLRATKTAVREGTYLAYSGIVRRELLPAFKDQTIRGITKADVRKLVVALRERGLKKSSVASVRGTLHALLEMAVEEGVLVSNPASYRGRSKRLRLAATAGELRATVKAMTEEQAQRFLATAARVAERRHCMKWLTELSTGLRPGEGAGLEPEDLDYGALRIRIARTVTDGRIGPAKTTAAGDFEDVDMPEGLAAELKSWEAACAAEALSQGTPRSRWLFPSKTGGSLDGRGTWRAFKRVLREAGLPGHFTPHSLRHSYITHLLRRGESVYYVSRQARHADISITVRTYGSSLPAGNRKAADRQFEMLSGQRLVRTSATEER